ADPDRRLRLAVDPAAFHRRASLTRAQHAAGARCRRAEREFKTSARLAFAEHTLAPPAGTARPIAVLALRRARLHGLDRRRGRGRSEGRRGRTCLIAQRLGGPPAHRPAPAGPVRRLTGP